MKTVEQKVEEFLRTYVGVFTNKQERELIKLLKAHDRDTRAENERLKSDQYDQAVEGDHNLILSYKIELEAKDKRIAALEGALREALEWNWLDDDAPKDKLDEFIQLLRH